MVLSIQADYNALHFEADIPVMSNYFKPEFKNFDVITFIGDYMKPQKKTDKYLKEFLRRHVQAK